MKKRSKQQNPEQKTRNGVEFGEDYDLLQKSKKAYEKVGGQPVKSKMHVENNKY